VRKILQTETDSKYRLYTQYEKTVEHIISACPLLAREQYLKDMKECVLNYTLTYTGKWG
jgi:hypothetical protein